MTIKLGQLVDFFSDPKGPIGLLVGGLIIGVIAMLYVYPYLQVPEQVNLNTEAIKKIKKKQKEQEKELGNLESLIRLIDKRQSIQFCNDPKVGRRYKQELGCENI